MKNNKINLYSGLAGMMGYFLGTILYELFFSTRFADDSLMKEIVILSTVAIVGILTYFYLKTKYPKQTKEMKTLEDDERGQLIRGKTSTYTLFFIALLTIILFTYAYVNKQMMIAKIIGGFYVLTVLFNIGMNTYLNKKI